MPARIKLVTGRIERLAVDAVVNAANRELAPGGGVDGALRRAAGPDLTRLTQTLPALHEGEAVLTPGFAAPARWIIHTAAPIWFTGGEAPHKRSVLASCYRNAIDLADAKMFKSIAFPCLGTGAFGWPHELACDVAISTCRTALEHTQSIEKLIFCCYAEADAELYEAALKVS
ncbi:MAG TPA: macro domain-containing protein [Caulobacterales bacterium]|nr:macro domain-containing protein [Caulobacterales bacterium]